jgi:hypothetical protein
MISQTISLHKKLEAGDGRLGLTLASITSSADHLQEVRKSSLGFGDWVFVKTIKSLYRIRALGGGLYEVSGGWFHKKGLGPVQLRISGCTWGGSAIKIDLIAACGLRIEFGNRLITSPVRKIFVLPHIVQN